MAHMHLLLTYFPHVLDIQYFAGHIHEMHAKYDRSAQSRKRKADSTKHKPTKAQSTDKTRLNTDVGEV